MAVTIIDAFEYTAVTYSCTHFLRMSWPCGNFFVTSVCGKFVSRESLVLFACTERRFIIRFLSVAGKKHFCDVMRSSCGKCRLGLSRAVDC